METNKIVCITVGQEKKEINRMEKRENDNKGRKNDRDPL